MNLTATILQKSSVGYLSFWLTVQEAGGPVSYVSKES
jgi:hypothetical protein